MYDKIIYIHYMYNNNIIIYNSYGKGTSAFKTTFWVVYSLV